MTPEKGWSMYRVGVLSELEKEALSLGTCHAHDTLSKWRHEAVIWFCPNYVNLNVRDSLRPFGYPLASPMRRR